MRRRVFWKKIVYERMNLTFTKYKSTHGCLLNDDALDEEILKLQVLCVRVRLGVLQETSDELHRLLGPATCEFGASY